MGYEPLAGGNSAANSNNAEKQKNEGGKKETPFDYVKEVLDDLKNYESQVEEFSCASSSDKGYRYLDEMLTLCILRLDCINIDGNDELRKYRKSAINEVNRVAAILESKVSKTESTAADEKTPSQQNDSQEDSQTSAAVAAEQAAAEPKNKKEAKKLEKAKAKKEKEEKEKAEKAKKEAAAGEKKEGRRIILFRGKNKNKAAAVAAPSGDEAAGTSRLCRRSGLCRGNGLGHEQQRPEGWKGRWFDRWWQQQ
ncbi:BAG domain [Tyrophagus putrescentiae]|nr:BAG domain [Tyrophagus putrescentiae]